MKVVWFSRAIRNLIHLRAYIAWDLERNAQDVLSELANSSSRAPELASEDVVTPI
jgi:hypothetical protein